MEEITHAGASQAVKTATEPRAQTGGAIDAKPLDETTFRHGEERAEPERIDPDDALRAAIKAAVDAGDFARVKALVAVLEAWPKPAAVLSIARPGKR